MTDTRKTLEALRKTVTGNGPKRDTVEVYNRALDDAREALEQNGIYGPFTPITVSGRSEPLEPGQTLPAALALAAAAVAHPQDAQAALEARDERVREEALGEAAKPLIWEDTLRVSFDDSVQWGKGYDFDSWELLREEANTADGRFAVWKCPVRGWSYYGGSLGWHQGGFVDEAAAKDAVRSHHILALVRQDDSMIEGDTDE